MLLMVGFSTLIQMKDHPIILAMVENTQIYHSHWVRNLKSDLYDTNSKQIKKN